MKKKNNVLKTVLIVASVILFIVLVAMLFTEGNGPKEIAYAGEGSLLEKINNGEIEGLHIVDGYVAYAIVKDSQYKSKFPSKADYVIKIPNRNLVMEDIARLNGANAKMPNVTYNNPASKSSFTSMIIPALGLVAIGILMFLMYKQTAGTNSKAMNFSKTKARLSANVKVKFSDVAGAEEEKEELKEVVEFLKNAKKFEDVGARIPKGVLLVGPPGTGKTLFAKAVAGEANVPFFSISGSDFVEMFVGTGAARVRDLFEQAKKNMPCIIFIDEIDAVGRQRGAGLGGGNDEREQTLNQLLVQMDGFEKNDGIIIMAATNRADILDPALMRPGRFDRQIFVNPPDVKGREEILKVHSRNKPLDADVSFKILARMTSGFTGADLENLLNEAAILAARAGRKVILMEDVLEGINKVIAGPQKKSHVVTESDKRITSYHEAGHAILGKLLPNCDAVQEVSIIPRGMAAGYTLTRPENDDSHVTKNKLTDMICMMLGGRAAEEIVIHDISTGASNDIQRASDIAHKMVTEWGMSKVLGNIFLGGSQEVFLGRDYQTQHSYSEQIAGIVDKEIKEIIDTAYEKALKLLKENRSILDNMVKVLYEKETIYTDEVNLLFEGKTAEEVNDYIDSRNEKVRNKKRYNFDIVPEPTAEEDKTEAKTDKDVKADNKTDGKDA
ncbi:MAG: ATP-dependent zinc metalloprotease FtsH, partial [Clostridia bacterium]